MQLGPWPFYNCSFSLNCAWIGLQLECSVPFVSIEDLVGVLAAVTDCESGECACCEGTASLGFWFLGDLTDWIKATDVASQFQLFKVVSLRLEVSNCSRTTLPWILILPCVRLTGSQHNQLGFTSSEDSVFAFSAPGPSSRRERFSCRGYATRIRVGIYRDQSWVLFFSYHVWFSYQCSPALYRVVRLISLPVDRLGQKGFRAVGRLIFPNFTRYCWLKKINSLVTTWGVNSQCPVLVASMHKR